MSQQTKWEIQTEKTINTTMGDDNKYYTPKPMFVLGLKG